MKTSRLLLALAAALLVAACNAADPVAAPVRPRSITPSTAPAPAPTDTTTTKTTDTNQIGRAHV